MLEILFNLIWFFHLLAAVSFIGAVAFVVKLYLETDKGWYWLCLVLSIFLIAFSEWLTILLPFGIRDFVVLGFLMSEICQIIGCVLLAISFFGMYNTMKAIRKRVD